MKLICTQQNIEMQYKIVGGNVMKYYHVIAHVMSVGKHITNSSSAMCHQQYQLRPACEPFTQQ